MRIAKGLESEYLALKSSIQFKLCLEAWILEIIENTSKCRMISHQKKKKTLIQMKEISQLSRYL